MPGVALWHVSWVGKDDTIDWQAYFHARNRIVAGLLHSDAPRGGTLLRHSRRVDLKHLMMMQYYPVALRHRALRDILSGPEHMRANLATAMPAARALAATSPRPSSTRTPACRCARGAAVRCSSGCRSTTSTTRPACACAGSRCRRSSSHWFHAPRPENVAQPEVEFGKGDAHWWRLPRLRQRAGERRRRLGQEHLHARSCASSAGCCVDSVRLHRRLRREWPKLSRPLPRGGARADLAVGWQQTFEESS